MYKTKKQKLLYIFALVLGIASLSVGFAAFSTTLNISSSASVAPNSSDFSVKFSKYQNYLSEEEITAISGTNGIETTNGQIINGKSPTITNLSVTFAMSGSYVEYRFYIRNEGAYTAYLNNINFIGDKTCIAGEGTTESLAQAACEAIEHMVIIGNTQYNKNTQLTNMPLEAGSSQEVRVRIEYNIYGAYADGPFSVTLPSIAIVYSSVDDSSIKPTVTRVVSGDINTEGSIVAIGNEEFYVIGEENNNVKLLSMYNLHVGNKREFNSDAKKWKSIIVESPTGIQNSNSRGYVEGEKIYIGVTAFSSDFQKGTTYNEYNGSIVEVYVENYQNYLISLGANIAKSRLITTEELDQIGCNSSGYDCSSAPEWVYSSSYWTGTPNGTENIWYVRSNGSYDPDTYDYATQLGVRPVIEIPISEFE